MNIVIYGDSVSWGIIPNTRNRLPFEKRWGGVLQSELGGEYHIIEECLNGRTTQYDDVNRPARNGLEHIQMVLESHSPIDVIIVMLGINDFQDVIGVTSEESACGLRNVIQKIQQNPPEPMKVPPRILVIIPPEIEAPLGVMAEKFSGYSRGKGSEKMYCKELDGLDVSLLKASEYIALSKIDGIHLDEPEHYILGKEVGKRIMNLTC
ncbi:MAG: SGNH/GDSL hydrolase family protein [Pseudomonadales bacterium]|nr:SGNH/GDSL hydrolase family protein [Pseudomonadales bacterium]